MSYHHRQLSMRDADWSDVNKKEMESICHQEGMCRAVELMNCSEAAIIPPEEQYVLICCICFLTMCQN